MDVQRFMSHKNEEKELVLTE